MDGSGGMLRLPPDVDDSGAMGVELTEDITGEAYAQRRAQVRANVEAALNVRPFMAS